ISHEACALAGAWKLNKLIALYDDNGISIDGKVTPWFIDDTPARFKAYGWNVISVDGHDVQAVSRAIASAQHSADKPTLIACKTHIGQGSPNRVDTAKAHGEPLGAEEIALTRAAIQWPHAPFHVPAEVYADWDAKAKGAANEQQWQNAFHAYANAHPQLAAEYKRRMAGELPKDFHQTVVDAVVAANTKADTVASRKASQLALEAFTGAIPELLGGSADLTGSNLTNTSHTPNMRVDLAGRVVKNEHGQAGRHINYGVREFGMAAIMNGIALHGGFIPYGGTFLTFSPADTAETTVAWAVALQNAHRPTALLLSRQNLPYLPKGDSAAKDASGLDAINKGAYVLAEPSEVGMHKKAQAVIIATGSEVQLALKAQALLAEHKVAVRVVSMPSTTTFDRQSVAYKSSVLPAGVPRIAVEMGSTDGWWKYGVSAVVGIDTYGESAPAPVLFKHFGFTPENVADTVRAVLQRA
ncbi:MAG: transketolase, partial [Betaproteobacteria bacterium]|nr:transketolase [Betaproteobacteria bacterium]